MKQLPSADHGDTEFVSASKQIIRQVLQPLIGDIPSFVLLDFPDHDNVGDSAIWLGEIVFFKAEARQLPRYVCTFDAVDYDLIGQGAKDEPIFLHGGGNFGDIWPAFQNFREKIIKKFPNRRIIQMPQTIHFTDAAALKASAAIINAHLDFTLLVRDQSSFELATANFSCKVIMCPDMAFYLGNLAQPHESIAPVFMLLREDIEVVEGFKAFSDHPHQVADWQNPMKNKSTRAFLKLRATILGLIRGQNAERRKERYFNDLALARVKTGIEQLCIGKHLITDRLHAHILATLLQIRHVCLDNNYGKISKYIAAWESAQPNLLAKTVPAALALLGE